MTNSVISLYDRTGIMVRPWALDGCDCFCVDTQHSIRKPKVESVGKGSITYLWGDARTWCPSRSVRKYLRILFAFPPCTDVTVADARDFLTKGTALLRDALEMFSIAEHAGKWSGKPYMIENPIGKFSSHMGDPNHIFQPWHYGDLWSKQTCLWVGNGFVIPRKTHYDKTDKVTEKIWKMAPSDERANLRSETPPMFAKAVFLANQHILK